MDSQAFRERGTMGVGGRIAKVPAAGYVARFERDGMHLYAKSGANTTAMTCQPFATLPVGLSFTLDNSDGSGSMTLTPASGSAVTVTAGKAYRCTVVGSGDLLAVELTAAP
jgi:hypothetical protein